MPVEVGEVWRRILEMVKAVPSSLVGDEMGVLFFSFLFFLKSAVENHCSVFPRQWPFSTVDDSLYICTVALFYCIGFLRFST